MLGLLSSVVSRLVSVWIIVSIIWCGCLMRGKKVLLTGEAAKMAINGYG